MQIYDIFTNLQNMFRQYVVVIAQCVILHRFNNQQFSIFFAKYF